MKTILMFLLAFVASAHSAAPVLSHLIRGNNGQSIPLFGAARSGEPVMGSEINLDTSEIDTSKYFYQLVDKPATGVLDTIGFVHFAYKDSTGTDSVRVRVIWYGNPQPDGKGVWSKIDSINQQGTSITSFTAATPKAVINSLGYAAIMFTIGNPSNSAVALKSTAKGVVLNRRQRIGSIGNF